MIFIELISIASTIFFKKITTRSLVDTLGYLQAICNSKNSITAGLDVVLTGASDPCVNIIKYFIFTFICM